MLRDRRQSIHAGGKPVSEAVFVRVSCFPEADDCEWNVVDGMAFVRGTFLICFSYSSKAEALRHRSCRRSRDTKAGFVGEAFFCVALTLLRSPLKLDCDDATTLTIVVRC